MYFNFKRWKVFTKSFLIVSTGVILFYSVPYLNQLTQQAEQMTLDLRYRNFNRISQPSPQVVLVDLDEESLKKYSEAYGRWPWPRRAHKEIISFIGEGKPSMILFDVLFSEPQKESDDDQILGEVSAQYKNVSHAALFLPQSETEGVNFVPLPKDRNFPNPLQWKETPPHWFGEMQFHSLALPTTSIWSQTPYVHSVNVTPDSDGILRRIPLVIHYNGQWIPTLALRGILSQSLNKPTQLLYKNSLLEVYESDQTVNSNLATSAVQTPPLDQNPNPDQATNSNQIPSTPSAQAPIPSALNTTSDYTLKYRIPVDEKGNLFLHYYANNNQLTQIRVGEILDSAKAKEAGDIENIKIDPEIFKDKVVIVGTSAMGLDDLKVTPIGKQFPGVLLHATAISNVLNNDYLQEAPANFALALTLLLVFLSYFSIFFIEIFFVRNILPPLALFGTSFIAIYLFRYQSLHIPMALPLLAGGLSLLHGYLHMAIIESRQRKMIQGTLSKYLSPTVTKHLVESGINPTAEIGKWKEISILFSDIRGFTTLSEGIAPDFLVRILNEYLGDMTDIIFNHEGTLDKFIGDAVMAFWGAPLDDESHAQKAVSAAIHMVRAVEHFNARNKQNTYPPLKIGIGVHTGKAIVGNIGSNKRLDYTIIGDNVNLASRLEGLTKEYSIPLLISGTTYETVKDYFICRPLDVVVAKGKTQSVPLYQPLAERRPGPDAAKYESLCFMFTDAFKLYQQGQFSWALESFKKIKDKYPEDGPTLLYIARCQDLIQKPPLSWNGVYVATSK